MKLLRNLSIRHKLTVITMMISIVALVLSSAAFIIYDTITFRSQMAHELTIFAEVMGKNAEGALEFMDAEAAEEILSQMKIKSNIVSAVFYHELLGDFAKYHRDGIDFKAPDLQEDGTRFTDNHLEVFKGVDLLGDNVGAIYLQSDLSEIDIRLKRFAKIVFVVILAVSLVAFLLMQKLQHLISAPILHLVDTAKRVSEEKNYSIRAVAHNQDEIGLLIHQFNEMLEQIQTKDKERRDFNKSLEARVNQRTKKLREEVVVRGNQVLGYEALSRDPQGKLNVFQLFNKYQAIGKLNDLKTICLKTQIKKAQEVGLERVFINVDFNVLEKIEVIPLPPSLEVILEISEMEALHEVENRLEISDRWRSEGYKFAIDDFGAGFISLPFIARLVPEYIKIDRSTILQSVASEQFREFLNDLIAALRNYAKEGIIAEGIETEKELSIVKNMGIFIIQGFLLGKPQEIKRSMPPI